MFGKIYECTFTGSMFGRGPIIFAVWSYVLANTKPDNLVELNPQMLSSILGTSIESVELVIKELCSPDPKSRTKREEGRRLLPKGEMIYFVVNASKYRGLPNDRERRAYFSDKQREHRQRLKERQTGKSNDVKDCQTLSSSVKHSEAEAEAEEEAPKKGTPTCEKDVVDFCKSLTLPESDGIYFWNKWVGNGSCNAGKKMKDWRAVIRSWKAGGHCPSQKVSRTPFNKIESEKQSRLELEMKEAREKYEKTRTSGDNNQTL